MEAKQLTSGLFEVDVGAIPLVRHLEALKTLSRTIDDKELLGLLKIDTEQLQRQMAVVQEQGQGEQSLTQVGQAAAQAMTMAIAPAADPTGAPVATDQQAGGK